MIFSFAVIFISAMSLGGIFNKIRLPSLIGMILAGFIFGPYLFNVIDESVLNISSELRQIALIVILSRAGLSLDINDLKKAGTPAFLLCFIPALCEIAGFILLAPLFFNLSRIDAAVMGSVIAAVSPAVVVPRMIKLMNENAGTHKSIPQMIMAAASADDVLVIVLFYSFLSAALGGAASAYSFISIPFSVIIGIIAGIFSAFVLKFVFKTFYLCNDFKAIIFLSVSFTLVYAEKALEGVIPISGLLGVMAMGMALHKLDSDSSLSVLSKFSSIWKGAEILLFFLVGAAVDIKFALNSGISSIILIFAALLFRMGGVQLCLLKTKLNIKERVFCMFAYMPKATVQAAIGAVPLTAGLADGNIILTAAVTSIVVTAPIGALLIDMTYKKLLN